MKLLLFLCSDHKNTVSSCDFSYNNMYLATASWDKTVNIYDITCGSFRSTGPTKIHHHEGCVNYCSFSQDSKLVE